MTYRSRRSTQVILICVAFIIAMLVNSAYAAKKDHDIMTLQIRFVVGVDGYEHNKNKVDKWIQEQIETAERFYSDKPRLEIKKTVIRKTFAGGRSLARLHFNNGHSYRKYMDKNFDNVAVSKTNGYLQVVVTDSLCIGWERDKKTGKRVRSCWGGYAFFPSWVMPFSRKHGITLTYPDSRAVLAHELGHFFGLKHTFEPYVNVDPRLNCNQGYQLRKCGACLPANYFHPEGGCKGTANLMDYCFSRQGYYLNDCQKRRAAKQRKQYMTRKGETNYRKIKGLR